jgi:hypothetical protein
VAARGEVVRVPILVMELLFRKVNLVADSSNFKEVVFSLAFVDSFSV